MRNKIDIILIIVSAVDIGALDPMGMWSGTGAEITIPIYLVFISEKRHNGRFSKGT